MSTNLGQVTRFTAKPKPNPIPRRRTDYTGHGFWDRLGVVCGLGILVLFACAWAAT